MSYFMGWLLGACFGGLIVYGMCQKDFKTEQIKTEQAAYERGRMEIRDSLLKAEVFKLR